MTYEQKFVALQALLVFDGSAAVHMRKPGDWYVSLPGVNRRKEHLTESVHVLGCKTPEDAIDKYFESATKQEWPLEIDTRNGKKRLVKWNGFMWADAEMPR